MCYFLNEPCETIIAVIVLVLSQIEVLRGQTSPFNSPFDPWTKSDLYDTDQLAQALTDKNIKNDPVIFNIEPVSNIIGAVQLGAASREEGITKLKDQLITLAKDKEIIVYCGCCPFNKCPNIRPAFTLLKQGRIYKGFSS